MKFKKLKSLILSGALAFGFMGMSAFTGTTTVHASELSSVQNTWSATLPSYTRSVNTQTSYPRAYDNSTPQISLTRIVNGPSYFMDAYMVNSGGTPRTNTIKVQQNAGFASFSNYGNMENGKYYNLVVSNDYFETTARSAYGYIKGFMKA